MPPASAPREPDRLADPPAADGAPEPAPRSRRLASHDAATSGPPPPRHDGAASGPPAPASSPLLGPHAVGRPLGSPTRAARDPLELPVLLVNRLFVPVQITTARRGLLLLFGGAALALDESGELHEFARWRSLPVRDRDDALPIVGGALRVPRVLHLRRYERVRRPVVRLTRHNLMLRDGHQCQYCARRPPVRDLNIDHVIPRSRGGPDSWENLVTACRPCNLRKGRKTPDEAGMYLLRAPAPPRWSATMELLHGEQAPFEEWSPFLRAG